MTGNHIVIDGRAHLIGRLSSYVAKALLQGTHISVVRCEQINISGIHFRAKTKFMNWLRKRMNTNPRRNPIHFREPSRVFARTVRGMIPHKTKRGAAALGRLKCYEGVPLSLNGVKRMVCSDALRVVRLKPRSKFCTLGRVQAECGWNRQDLVEELENKRHFRNAEWHVRRTEAEKAKATKVNASAEVRKINEELAKYGY